MQFSDISPQKNISKHQKSIYSYNNVYQINHEERKDPSKLYNFKSPSIDPVRKCTIILSKPQDCATQTSKTILELAQIDSMTSPHTKESPLLVDTHETNKLLLLDYERMQNSIDSTITSSSTLNNRASLDTMNCSILSEGDANYLDSCESLIDSQKNCYLQRPIRSGGSLTQIFLSKTNSRNSASSAYFDAKRKSICSATKSCASSKSYTVQAIHPNYISAPNRQDDMNCIDNLLPEENINNIRETKKCLYSKSMVEPPLDNGQETTSNNLLPCFYDNCSKTVIRRKPSSDVKYDTKIPTKTPFGYRPPLLQKHNSFMSSTAASEHRNQMPGIMKVRELWSPIKRGRSSSPKPYYIQDLKSPKKVPYIDQSQTVINSEPSEHSVKTVEQISVLTKNKCPTTKKMTDVFKVDLKNSNDTIFDSESIQTIPSSFSSIISIELTKLRQTDWNEALRGLANIIEIARVTDASRILPYMSAINQRLFDLLKSPRSYVSRTACQAAGHLFEYMKDTRRPEFDDIVDCLLFKTADANKFIRQDANLALDCMVTHIPSHHTIRALCSKGPTHKNPLVRIATARLIICAVVITGPGVILQGSNCEFTRKRVLVNMANFLEDKSMETRKYGQRLYKALCKEPNFEMYLTKFIEKEQVARIKKLMK